MASLLDFVAAYFLVLLRNVIVTLGVGHPEGITMLVSQLNVFPS